MGRRLFGPNGIAVVSKNLGPQSSTFVSVACILPQIGTTIQGGRGQTVLFGVQDGDSHQVRGRFILHFVAGLGIGQHQVGASSNGSWHKI